MRIVKKEIRIRVRPNEHEFDSFTLTAVAISQIDDLRTVSIAQPVVFVQKTEEQIGEIINPCACISLEDAQLLMEELWNCGIRPRSEIGSVGQLGAMKEHLGDLRRIIFGDKEPTKRT